MTFKHKLTFLLAIFALSSSIAMAEGSAPSNIAAVTARGNADGSVTVEWKSASDAKAISFYRVYFSSKSILENGGDYDDFERTKGVETTLTLRRPSGSAQKLFVGILAVNTDGIESEGFEVEAMVELNKESQTSSARAVSSSAAEIRSSAPITTENPASVQSSAATVSTTSVPMSIISLQPLSSTGILITFSKNLAKDNNVTVNSFTLTESGKTLVPIAGIQKGGASILLTVSPMKPDQLYVLSVIHNITAEDGTNLPGGLAPIALKTPAAVLVTVEKRVEQPTRKPVAVQPLDPSALDLEPRPMKDGTYTVYARWMPQGNPSAFVLSTTNDGQRFANASIVGAEETSVRYSRIRPGTFGVRVAAQERDGALSPGISKVIDLPSTGIGLIGLAGAAGALAARRRKREEDGGM